MEVNLDNWTPGMYYAILQTSSEQFVKAFNSLLSLDTMLSAILDDEGKRQSVVQKFLLRLSPRERLEGLSPDEIKSYLEEIENK